MFSGNRAINGKKLMKKWKFSTSIALALLCRAVGVPSLEVLSATDGALSSLVWFGATSPQQELALDGLRPSHSVIHIHIWCRDQLQQLSNAVSRNLALIFSTQSSLKMWVVFCCCSLCFFRCSENYVIVQPFSWVMCAQYIQRTDNVTWNFFEKLVPALHVSP